MLKYVAIISFLIIHVASPSYAGENKTQDPTLKTVLQHLPDIKDKNVKIMVSDYTELAKKFWLNKECDFLGGSAKKEFVQNLATTTEILRTTFMKEFSMTFTEAQKETEKPQMWALNEMSAKKFYGCDKGLNKDMVIAVVQTREFIKKYGQ